MSHLCTVQRALNSLVSLWFTALSYTLGSVLLWWVLVAPSGMGSLDGVSDLSVVMVRRAAVSEARSVRRSCAVRSRLPTVNHGQQTGQSGAQMNDLSGQRHASRPMADIKNARARRLTDELGITNQGEPRRPNPHDLYCGYEVCAVCASKLFSLRFRFCKTSKLPLI